MPHFEKMLYDNALLCRVYAHRGARSTGSELARRVAVETADFMVRELRTDEGGFSLRARRRQRRRDRDRPARRGGLLRLDAPGSSPKSWGSRTRSSPRSTSV
ncbi:hypothetical protein ACRAWF_40985 [Streptomyces sp. L7]